MKVSQAVEMAYSTFYRTTDFGGTSSSAKFDSTREACHQAQANQIYRAVEHLPPHQGSLLRLCFTESGTEIDALRVCRKLLDDFWRTNTEANLPTPRVAQMSIVAFLTVRNFRRMVLTSKDEFTRKDFAEAVGMGPDYYADVMLNYQKQMEKHLIDYLADALGPVKRILKQR